QYPAALVQTLLAQPRELAQCGLRIVAVDGDRLEGRERPAEAGDEQQFALDHLAQRLEQAGKKEGFPGALVFGQDDTGLGRDVLQPVDPIVDARHYLREPDRQSAPTAYRQVVTALE